MALFDAFLKLDGIIGDSQGGEIRLESFSWGVSNSSSGVVGSGEGAGKASFQDFTFSAQAGRQSPQLFGAAARGTRINNAILTVGDKVEPLVIRFSDVFISNYKLDEGALFTQKCAEGPIPGTQLGAPLESVSFNFVKIEFQAGRNIATGGANGIG
jgi:type VI protein secretion system component Hcp